MSTPDPPDPPARRANARLQAVRGRLGQEPDGVIAAELGVARKTVILFRQRLGISAFHANPGGETRRKPASPPAPRAPRPSRLDAFGSVLGTLPDREVAERAGVTTENVRMYRLRRGIAAGWRGEAAAERAPAGQPTAGRPVMAPQPALMFRITATHRGTRHHFGVVAIDVVDAARRARDALLDVEAPWVIRGIRLVGTLLPERAGAAYSLAAATSTTS